MEFKPHTWWRFIHDIFIIGMEGEEKLRESLDYLNDSHDTIKFTSKWSKTNRCEEFHASWSHLSINLSLVDGHTMTQSMPI